MLKASLNAFDAPFYLVLNWLSLGFSLVVCVTALPLGIELLFRYAFSFATPLSHRQEVSAHLHQVRLDADSVTWKLQNLEKQFPSLRGDGKSLPQETVPSRDLLIVPNHIQGDESPINIQETFLMSLEESVRRRPSLTWIHNKLMARLQELRQRNGSLPSTPSTRSPSHSPRSSGSFGDIFQTETPPNTPTGGSDALVVSQSMLSRGMMTMEAENISPLTPHAPHHTSPVSRSFPEVFALTGPYEVVEQPELVEGMTLRRRAPTAVPLDEALVLATKDHAKMQKELDHLRKRQAALEAAERGRLFLVWSNIVYVVLLSLCSLLFFTFVILVTFSGLKGLWNPQNLGLKSFHGIFNFLRPGESNSTWGEVFLEVGVVTFVNIGFVVGVYNMPIFSWILKRSLQKKKGMILPELAFNVVVLLTLSSTLPVVVRLLGVTTVNVTGVYTFYAFLRDYRFSTFLYKLVVLAFSIGRLQNLMQHPHRA